MRFDFQKNAANILSDIEWLQAVLEQRFRHSFAGTYATETKDVHAISPPALNSEDSSYAHFVENQQLDFENRLLLVLGLVPHIQPDFLYWHLVRRKDEYATNGPLHAAGGITGLNFKGFIPTGLTYLFIAAGLNAARRMEVMDKLLEENSLYAAEIVKILPSYPGEPVLSGAIALNEACLRYLTTGKKSITELTKIST